MNDSSPLLFVGIDVGKTRHSVAFLSKSLLIQYKHFSKCPTLKVTQDRVGVNTLLTTIRSYAPLEKTAVVLEQTGHYHRALTETLLSEGLQVYVIAVHAKKGNGLDKNDKIDAQRLANLLYGQVALGQQIEESSRRVERRLPPRPAAAALAPLVRLHYELTQQQTRVKNKLTAICDELFPEFVQVFQDVNGAAALGLRERFPTPASIAAASLEELQAMRRGSHPTNSQLKRLKELAPTSIGVKNKARLHGLLLEQRQLIAFFHLVHGQLASVDAEIKEIVESSREGQILLSLPAIGVHH